MPLFYSIVNRLHGKPAHKEKSIKADLSFAVHDLLIEDEGAEHGFGPGLKPPVEFMEDFLIAVLF